MGSEDEIKRRNVLSKLNIDSIDSQDLPSDASAATIPNTYEVIPKLPPINATTTSQEEEPKRWIC